MPEIHKLQLDNSIETQKRMPRRPKAGGMESKFKLHDKGTRFSEKKIKVVNVPGNPNNPTPAYNVGAHDETQTFEFVTLTGQLSSINRNETSKRVRTQAMRDFLRKQSRQAATGVLETVSSTNPEEPSTYKGRFKLDTWSHKNSTKTLKTKRAAKLDETKEKQEAGTGGGPKSHALDTQLELFDRKRRRRSPTPDFIPTNGRLDPFDSLAVPLGPHSERLLVHYNTSYSMNSVAINAEGDFFKHAKTDPALLHAILYLVALHYDLKYGILDSPESLYHGGEAFRMINERLSHVDAEFSDMTIAAVAMLVTKENLNGKYDLSKIHMQGLQYMVTSRGGIQMLNGVFRRIVAWSDFCFANVWNCQPVFARLLSSDTRTNSPIESSFGLLNPEDLFGSESPMVPIFTNLRVLSFDLDPDHIFNVDRLRASNMIYATEYDLLSLNKVHADDLEPSECLYSFEAVPLKTAAHLYLYLVIREVPLSSALVYRLVQRLQESLEEQLPGWWNSNVERQTWLLWMLFVGGIAAAGSIERWWFVKELGNTCRMLGIWSGDAFREGLKQVLWQEAWCEDHCMVLWQEVGAFEELEGSSLSPEAF